VRERNMSEGIQRPPSNAKRVQSMRRAIGRVAGEERRIGNVDVERERERDDDDE
jgi:hypothetical protein